MSALRKRKYSQHLCSEYMLSKLQIATRLIPFCQLSAERTHQHETGQWFEAACLRDGSASNRPAAAATPNIANAASSSSCIASCVQSHRNTMPMRRSERLSIAERTSSAMILRQNRGTGFVNKTVSYRTFYSAPVTCTASLSLRSMGLLDPLLA